MSSMHPGGRPAGPAEARHRRHRRFAAGFGPAEAHIGPPPEPPDGPNDEAGRGRGRFRRRGPGFGPGVRPRLRAGPPRGFPGRRPAWPAHTAR